MKYFIGLSVIAFIVTGSLPCLGQYFFPSPFCYWNSFDDGTPFYDLAYHCEWQLDSTFEIVVPRIGIWEPDPGNSCSWEIPFQTSYFGDAAIMPVQFEFNDYLQQIDDPNLGISFVENKPDYFEDYPPSGVETNSVSVYDWDTWEYKFADPPIYGYTTNQLYNDPPWYRVWYTTIQVLNDPNHTPPNGHASYDVLRHEIGHALLFGDDSSSFDGMFLLDYEQRTKILGPIEKSMLQCVYQQAFPDACGQNVATKVSGFRISENLNATWEISSNSRVDYFLIQGLDGDVWGTVADTVFVSGTDYSVQLDGPMLSRYRLVEYGVTHAEVLCYGSPGTSEVVSGFGPMDSPIDLLVSAKSEYFSSPNSQIEVGLRDDEEMVIFTSGQFISTLQAHGEPLWSGIWGCSVSYVNVDLLGSTPDQIRTSIEAAINTFYQNGVEHFFIVGSANDYQQLMSDWWEPYWWDDIRTDYFDSGYPVGGMPGRDIVPTWYYEDSGQPDISMSRITPYWYSDFEYSDVSGDGGPDISIGRWPASTVEELHVLLAKMYRYSILPIWDNLIPSRVFFFAGDESYRILFDDSGIVRNAVSDANSSIPTSVLNWTLYMSEVEDLSQLSQLFTSSLNSTYPNLVVIFSNGSNEYSLGGFLDKATWDIAQLDNGNESIYLAATCLTGDYARTYSYEAGPQIVNDFLFCPTRGASFWIGSTNATWQNGNVEMMKEICNNIYLGNSTPMIQGFTNAQISVLGDNSESLHIKSVAKSYSFFGDPLSPFRGGGISPVDVPAQMGKLHFKVSVFPNPFNPRTEISVSISETGNYSIGIYDVRGMLVRSLYSGELDLGNKVFIWNGIDSIGRNCPAGVYFVRVNGVGGEVNSKLMLLK